MIRVRGRCFIMKDSPFGRPHYLRAKRYSSDSIFTKMLRLIKKQNLSYTITVYPNGHLIEWRDSR